MESCDIYTNALFDVTALEHLCQRTQPQQDEPQRSGEIVGFLDLTRLEEEDTKTAITDFSRQAVSSLGRVATICVYPRYIPWVKEATQGLSIKIATAANFPTGKEPLKQVLATIEEAIQLGADEIDVVWPYAEYLAGREAIALEAVKAYREATEGRILKIILETGCFEDAAVLAKAATAVAEQGVDFLKTSTGRIPAMATPSAASILLWVIRQQQRSSLGLKVSGGVYTRRQALHYLHLAEAMMGRDFLIPRRFRLGASRLLQALLSPESEQLKPIDLLF